MTNLKIKLATSIATATVLVAAIAPATFASTIKIKDNAKKSVNVAGVLNVNTTFAAQMNYTGVANLTTVGQNTGNNKANDNGKGDVKVTSGDAKSTVTNHVTTGGNDATLTPCGCAGTGDDITISGNGKKSLNLVLVGNVTTTAVVQSNSTNVVNATVVSQNTGGNKANDNVGKGDVTVTSGDATSNVTNTVTTGGNSLTL